MFMHLPKSPLVQMMHHTTPRFQKKLALAHHLKTVGNQPAMSNKMTPLEQEAGAQLAQTKYPLSPELEAQMKAQASAQPDRPNELSAQEMAAKQATDDDKRESLP